MKHNVLERLWQCSGFDCVVQYNPNIGIRLGYIRIPEDHPWYELPCEDHPCAVHGGVTFADHHPGFAWSVEIPSGFWIGFDCGHAFDRTPASDLEDVVKSAWKDLYEEPAPHIAHVKDWDLESVVAEVEWMAAQAAFVTGQDSLWKRMIKDFRSRKLRSQNKS